LGRFWEDGASKMLLQCGTQIDFLPVSARKSPADLVVAAGVVGLLHSVRPNQDAHLRSGVVALKVVDKKASEHPSAGGTRLTLIPTLPPKKAEAS